MASNIFENKNDSIPIDSTVVRYFYEKLDNQQRGDIKVWDTTTLSASFYDPTNQPMEYYQELSNSGHAHKNLEFSYPSTIGFNNKLTAYDKFIITKKDIIYPIIYQPFTEIKYMMGGKKEQHLDILFSREFQPRFFVTLKFNIDYAPSVYQRSFAQNYNFVANFRWNTRDNRYGVNGYYVMNDIDAYENGGITNDSLFTELIETDKTVIPVNLQHAKNKISVTGFGISQYFIISYSDIKKDKRIGFGRLCHSFDYQLNRYIYSDTDPTSGFYDNFDTLINKDKTYDSINFYTIRNSISWNSLSYGQYKNDIPFYLSVGLEHNYTYHSGYTDILTGAQFGKSYYQNIRATAGITMNILKTTRITGKGEIILTDYQAGDFMLEGQWKQFLGTFKKNFGDLVFNVNISRQSADWFEQYYYSNNFRWNNDFSPTTYIRLQGVYETPWFSIGLKQTTIDHYIYFDLDAKPTQHAIPVVIASAFANFYVRIRLLEVSGFASIQMSDNENILHLPFIHSKIKFGWNITLVKGVSIMQPSFVVNYFTEYYADAYMPALRTFYLQKTVKIGNYPFVDFYITFKLKRANIFLGYTNLYSFKQDNRYFTTPHYPMRDSRLIFGARWRLFK
ncbi:MAG: hypothetical protein II817_07700 [Bacteroidales bacterium]|nr:hypothetical protein [Bacteroidales bacterium]